MGIHYTGNPLEVDNLGPPYAMVMIHKGKIASLHIDPNSPLSLEDIADAIHEVSISIYADIQKREKKASEN